MVTSIAPATLFIDLGGVVVDVDESQAEQTLTRAAAVPHGTYARVFTDSGVKLALDLGRLSAEDALVAAAAEAPGVTAATLRDAHEAILTVRPAVVAWLNTLAAAGARLVVLSNTDPIHAEWIRTHAGLQADRWLFSYEFGLAKPDPNVFLAACERVGALPWETALVDDRSDNLSAAAGIGILGVHYTSLDAAQRSLAALGWESA